MKESRLVLWPQHGIYGTGRDMDEVFGLIETAEKPLKCTLMFVRRRSPNNFRCRFMALSRSVWCDTESWLFGRESIKTEKAMIKSLLYASIS